MNHTKRSIGGGAEQGVGGEGQSSRWPCDGGGKGGGHVVWEVVIWWRWPCGVGGGPFGGGEVAMWCERWPFGVGGGHLVWEVAMWCGMWPCGVGGGHVVWEVAMCLTLISL